MIPVVSPRMLASYFSRMRMYHRYGRHGQHAWKRWRQRKCLSAQAMPRVLLFVRIEAERMILFVSGPLNQNYSTALPKGVPDDLITHAEIQAVDDVEEIKGLVSLGYVVVINQEGQKHRAFSLAKAEAQKANQQKSGDADSYKRESTRWQEAYLNKFEEEKKESSQLNGVVFLEGDAHPLIERANQDKKDPAFQLFSEKEWCYFAVIATLSVFGQRMRLPSDYRAIFAYANLYVSLTGSPKKGVVWPDSFRSDES